VFFMTALSSGRSGEAMQRRARVEHAWITEQMSEKLTVSQERRDDSMAVSFRLTNLSDGLTSN
jgi:hypothetical protein